MIFTNDVLTQKTLALRDTQNYSAFLACWLTLDDP
jgi:hypothetical protein